jgi:hypothetical protein
MPAQQPDPAILRAHLDWARRHALFWLVLSLGVFAAAFWLFAQVEVPDGDRTAALVVLSTLILLNALWQAAALTLARLESLIPARADRGRPGDASP